MADVASVKLRLKDFEGARKDLDTCQSILDTFDSVENVVHASFYKVNADYYHVCEPAIVSSLTLLTVFFVSRQNSSLLHITETPSSTSHVSM